MIVVGEVSCILRGDNVLGDDADLVKPTAQIASDEKLDPLDLHCHHLQLEVFFLGRARVSLKKGDDLVLNHATPIHSSACRHRYFG